MTTYEIKVTWTLAGTNNAAGIGNDETIHIEADSAGDACVEAANGHIDHHCRDWESGKYDIVAEHVDGNEVYGVQFCEA